MLNIISLGAGVQSSTMALMAAHGEITPMPDCAIFADTQAEPKTVYSHLAWLEALLPFPVHHVTLRSLRDHVMQIPRGLPRGMTDARPPFFTESGGMLRRQCTQEYKIMPIQRKIGELIGHEHGSRWASEVMVSQWIGISTDEAQRMKPHKLACVQNRWPLIENNVSRNDCLLWMEKMGYPKPPKSACTFCPYHDDTMWREMKASDPESFADAVAVDVAIRAGKPGPKRPNGEAWYLHRSRKPLDEVDFRNAEDMGQLSMFGNECEGMCGV
jgi:hypothetical protein